MLAKSSAWSIAEPLSFSQSNCDAAEQEITPADSQLWHYLQLGLVILLLLALYACYIWAKIRKCSINFGSQMGISLALSEVEGPFFHFLKVLLDTHIFSSQTGERREDWCVCERRSERNKGEGSMTALHLCTGRLEVKETRRRQPLLKIWSKWFSKNKMTKVKEFF